MSVQLEALDILGDLLSRFGGELHSESWIDNIMAADALAPYVARTSAAMILTI